MAGLLDFLRPGLHRWFMERLRRIAVFLLILAVLPWGAYSGVRVSTSGASVGEVGVAQFLNGTENAAVPNEDPQAAFVAPAQKRCRTAALFGSPCGPHVTLSTTTITFDNPTSGQEVFRGPAKRLAAVVPSGPLDPPRVC